MIRRPTIPDVARAAGVSRSTVDRVLGGRIPVREETAARVLEAARALGHAGAARMEARLGAALPERLFGFVLQKGRQSFTLALREALERAVAEAPGIRGRAEIVVVPSQAPGDHAAAMEGLAHCDAVGAIAVGHGAVTEATERLQGRGVPVFAMLNDFAQGLRRSYVGLDNMRAGRIAGWCVAGMARGPGTLGVFVGGNRWHGHQLRETGFRAYARENAPALRALETLVNLETRQLTYEATLSLLERHRDLRGLYVAGGGMEGAIAALREARRPGEVVLAVNELTPESRAALRDRYAEIVVATPLGEASRRVVGAMAATLEGEPVPTQIFLPPEIHVAESV